VSLPSPSADTAAGTYWPTAGPDTVATPTGGTVQEMVTDGVVLPEFVPNVALLDTE
jgi:hypothetical protein